MRAPGLGERFDRLATGFGRWMSNPYTFLVVFTTILVWTIAGFFLGFAGSWLSAMHVTGPVVTLLLVFLLQHGQAKNTRALQLKLDELLATQEGARKSTIKSERRTTHELRKMEREGNPAAQNAPNNLQDTPAGAHGRSNTDANRKGRGRARRDSGQRRRRPIPGSRTRAPRLRGQDR